MTSRATSMLLRPVSHFIVNLLLSLSSSLFASLSHFCYRPLDPNVTAKALTAEGDITIESGTVIHPRAQILAESGPIVIGENNLIEVLSLAYGASVANDIVVSGTSLANNILVIGPTWRSKVKENVMLINRLEDGGSMNIGSNNVFEVACKVEGSRVGDNNVVESRAVVGPCVELTHGCIIGAGCELQTHEILPENTVICGSGCQRRINQERPPPQMSQLDYLRKALPNYHYLLGGKKP